MVTPRGSTMGPHSPSGSRPTPPRTRRALGIAPPQAPWGPHANGPPPRVCSSRHATREARPPRAELPPP
eukprot:scaffold19060_cov62-Phaeocystis_antarctica.AAC.11